MRYLSPPSGLILLAHVILLSTLGFGQAGGGSTASTTDRKQIIGQSRYRCKGGIQVQVTQMTNSARVDFAGRSQVLQLAPDGSGLAYQNNDFAWFSKGKTSYMKNTHSGGLTLNGCVALGN